MIQFDEKKKLFHLKNDTYSYIFEVVRDKYLLHRYWGRPLRTYNDAAAWPGVDRAFSPQPEAYENERTFSLDVLPQEYSAYGHGDFRIPAYEVELWNGTAITELSYTGYKICKGKPALEGLPASYGTEEEAETLEVELTDTNGYLTVYLTYTIFKNYPVLTRSVRFVNRGTEDIRLQKAASLSIDFLDHDFDRLSLYGAHAAERSVERVPLHHGIQIDASSRGASSHQHSPFLAIARPDAGEQHGHVYGFSLVYSGNFAMETEVEQFGTTRVVAGIHKLGFSWLLKEGETFQTPEVVMVYSGDGLNGMSQAYHAFYQNHVMRGEHQHKLRPILVNNWEATYFDFDEDKIDALASCAAQLGIELVVLDDGWFGKRDDDNSSLGDWTVFERKLPHGLQALAHSIHQRGLQFGLWFEPEMVSKDSRLFEAHPDWTLHVPDYGPTFSRHQLVLDLSRPEVQQYVIDAVSQILESAPIDYVKWDMNRHMTEVASASLPKERQGETAHRYMLGLYHVLETITQRFPSVLFESCSGGGGRFDAGLLYYMPQAWTSDNTDAICRQKIQYGTSLVFPPISMGAHVSVAPNHQVGRMTPLHTRAVTAMAGTFGYELDICHLTDEEKEEVARQVAFYKEIRPTIQWGTFTRLLSPFEGNETAWMFQSEDKTQVVVMYYKTLAEPAAPIRILRLAGLDEDALYTVRRYQGATPMAHDAIAGTWALSLEGRSFYGDELMYAGMAVEKVDADFASYIWVLEKES